MEIGTLATIIGPTMGVTVATAIGAVYATRGNTIRISIIEKRISEDRTENATAHAEIKELIIDSEKRILQALRNGMSSV